MNSIIVVFKSSHQEDVFLAEILLLLAAQCNLAVYENIYTGERIISLHVCNFLHQNKNYLVADYVKQTIATKVIFM